MTKFYETVKYLSNTIPMESISLGQGRAGIQNFAQFIPAPIQIILAGYSTKNGIAVNRIADVQNTMT